MIRVLIVDDSPTARGLIAGIVAADPALQVVGEACDGREGADLARRLRPDFVTMDLHMPRLDGLAATQEIMADAPTRVLIVTATGRAGEAELALSATRVGALGVLRKPAGPLDPNFEADARELVESVKSLAEVKVVRRWRGPASAAGGSAFPTPPPGFRPKAVAVAASTGGPAALHALLSKLPAKFPLPVLVVQHITPGFAAGLVNWLGQGCRLPVGLARDRDPLAGGAVHIAPDGVHLGVAGGEVRLIRTPAVGGFRPSATVLFSSVAKAFGRDSLGVILTGMGDDGLEGLRELRAAGGRVAAQDEATSVVYGMPGVVAAAGLADWELPPEAIAHLVARAAGV